MIAAVARNGVIGRNGALPWRLPSDFAFFRRMTMGKPLIMGRKTFEGIGRPLPGRTSIVVTRDAGYRPAGAIAVTNLGAALEQAQSIAEADGAGEVMIGGGGEIYREAMPLADRLYITHVALDAEGDTAFPEIEASIWREAEELAVPRSERDSAPFRILRYERR
jgi:dihydrofolate reductase